MPRQTIWTINPKMEKELITLSDQGLNHSDIAKDLSIKFESDVRKSQVTKKLQTLGLYSSPRNYKKRTQSHEELNDVIHERMGYVPASWEDKRATIKDKLLVVDTIDEFLHDTITNDESEVICKILLYLQFLEDRDIPKEMLDMYARLSRNAFMQTLNYALQSAKGHMAAIALQLDRHYIYAERSYLTKYMELPVEPEELMGEASALTEYWGENIHKLGKLYKELDPKAYEYIYGVIENPISTSLNPPSDMPKLITKKDLIKQGEALGKVYPDQRIARATSSFFWQSTGQLTAMLDLVRVSYNECLSKNKNP